MSFDLAKGWSDSAFTPTRALLAGLFIGGAFIVAMWSYGSLARWLTPDPTVAPACYGAERTNHRPGVELPPAFRRKTEDGLWLNPRGDHRVERMIEAEYACTVASCDRKAWEQYRSALFWYIAERLQRTRQLDAVYGDAGLARAQELFGGEADLRIERGLRERYQAGIFKIRNFRQDQDAVATLVLSGGKALRPCRRPDVAG